MLMTLVSPAVTDAPDLITPSEIFITASCSKLTRALSETIPPSILNVPVFDTFTPAPEVI